MMEPKETLRTLGIQTVTLRNPRSLRATLRNPTEPIFNKKLKSGQKNKTRQQNLYLEMINSCPKKIV